MKNSHIKFDRVDVCYSSLAYRSHSLKEWMFKTIVRKKPHHVDVTDVHALKNISFEIQRGERVGLIGHNGAGKSTLLKTIAQLYPLTSGTVDVIGDVRSLFELNLGFEPEATGRENIMYRGLLLGKKPREIRDMMDEIIAFTELGDFIDYPIKTYSAGMIVRLAFSISTSVPGDILLLDEVLAAGDAKFFIKAKKRINALIDDSELLVFATHEFPALRELCHRVFVMHQGELKFDGKPLDAIHFYHDLMGLQYHEKE